ncbi:hypothetical protein C8R46DRAFT_1055959 [Mycena filopes]|nr:hypothetical protein C8R46DRAFT_1055959 [Mycena filopes]
MATIAALRTINDIRSDNAAPDSDLWARADPTTISALTSLRKNLENASHSLSEDLYSSDSHFVLELVQNADDNVYGPDVTPSLDIILDLNSNTLVVACNEAGFNRSQVKAICKIGASTKKHQEGYIGMKCIRGRFKSVFKVADKVFISSGPYTFSFDKHAELGMITPSWAKDCPGREGWTQFTLHLSNTVAKEQLKLYLADVDPTLLLFLRKLRHLDLNLHDTSFTVQRYDLGSGLIRLDREDRRTGALATSQYLLVKSVLTALPTEKKRPNASRTELVLAFPLDWDGSPKIQAQAVHAFLPIRKYGFSFLIQGDFLALANREDVLADSYWNIAIRNELVPLFIDAIAEFQRRPGLELLWYRYIPIHTAESFFSPFAHTLLAKLKTMNVLRGADGRLHQPSTLRVANYVNDNGRPLIEERYIPHYYLSLDYDVTDWYFPILRELGVQTLSADEFINGLSRMSGDLPYQSTSWHEAVCAHLNTLRWNSRNAIIALPIVPLQDGSWVSLQSGDLFFSSDAIDIPRDLGLRLLAKLDPRSSRYSLFREMGVQVADFNVVSQKIVDLHRRSFPSKSAVLSHAQFLFAHRDNQGHLDLRQLYVLNRHRNLDRASNLYMDDDADDRTMPLSQIMSSPSHFLHSDYLRPPAHSSGHYWRAWLTGTLGVNLSPRVIAGHVSPEFHQFLTNPNSGSERILRALRDYWPKLQPPSLSTLGVKTLGENISAACEDGTSYPLSATALRRKALEPFSHLHFLLLDNPEDKAWNFLEELGVTTRPDGSLYLKWLRGLSLANSSDAQTITEIYTQLGARSNEGDNAADIEAAFDEDRLIFIPPGPLAERPGQWLPSSSVVWGGPPSMASRLRIPECPHDILLHEAIALTRTGPGLSADGHERLSRVLQDISSIISQSAAQRRANPAWISQLTSHPIFPVRVAGSRALVLRKLEEKFYIPDKGGVLFKIFGNEIDMLEPHTEVSWHGIHALLKSIPQLGLCYLDAAVSCTSSPGGRSVQDPEIQEHYLLRAPLIERMLNSTVSSSKRGLLRKFTGMIVFQVDSIVSTYTVDKSTHSHDEDLIIEEELDRFVVSFRTGCSADRRDFKFAACLAQKLCLDHDKVFIVMSTPHKLANIYLDAEGYSQQADNGTQDVDNSWATDFAHGPRVETIAQSGWKTTRPTPKHKSSVSSSVNEGHLTLTGLPDAATLIQLNMQSISDSAAGQNLVHTSKFDFAFSSLGVQNTGIDGQRQSTAMSTDNPGIVPTHMSLRGSLGGLSSIEMPYRPNAFTSSGGGSRTEATPAQLVNGVLGEYYIYEVLRKNLPNFTIENWTSELRGQVPGLPPFSSSSVADFRYSDTEGVLTRLFFSDDIVARWAAQWPEYHIEVKSTSDSGRSTPFHMSAHQLQTASQFTISAQEIPAAVYVLVRVWNIRSTSPSYKMCPDPHRCFYTGEVKIVSDVQGVLTSS